MIVRGPEGGLLRFVHGDIVHAAKSSWPDRPQRLAHVNLNSVDVDMTAAFYEKALGFRLTDRTRMMAFVRCNSDHHAVVIADASVNGLNLAQWRDDTNGSAAQATASEVDKLATQKKVTGTPTILVGPTGGALQVASGGASYNPTGVDQALAAAVANS